MYTNQLLALSSLLFIVFYNYKIHAQSNRKVDLDRVLACTPEDQETNLRHKVTITHIVDGDTFFAKDSLGTRKKYRLIGIDTPEFSHFGRPEEPYAQEATDYLKYLITSTQNIPRKESLSRSMAGGNKGVERSLFITYDLQPKDKYHRDLVYLYLPDGTFVNAELVRTGWAQVSTISPNITHAHTFIKLQRQARQQGRGVWKKDH